MGNRNQENISPTFEEGPGYDNSLIEPVETTTEEETTTENTAEGDNSEVIVYIFRGEGCPHCQEYKPIIKKIAGKYKFNLYFFEIDNLNEEEYETLFNTYELSDFTEQIPFTFIVRENKYINGTTGYASQDKTIEYLKSMEIIKN